MLRFDECKRAGPACAQKTGHDQHVCPTQSALAMRRTRVIEDWIFHFNSNHCGMARHRQRNAVRKARATTPALRLPRKVNTADALGAPTVVGEHYEFGSDLFRDLV